MLESMDGDEEDFLARLGDGHDDSRLFVEDLMLGEHVEAQGLMWCAAWVVTPSFLDEGLEGVGMGDADEVGARRRAMDGGGGGGGRVPQDECGERECCYSKSSV